MPGKVYNMMFVEQVQLALVSFEWCKLYLKQFRP
jgi:hypothetical protein